MESVSVSTARQRADPTSPLRNARWRVVVRLDLVPAARWNRADHPELEHLWELPPVKNSYRLPLGPAHAAVPRLDEAMVRFAATKYCGVLDEGTFGLGFS